MASQTPLMPQSIEIGDEQIKGKRIDHPVAKDVDVKRLGLDVKCFDDDFKHPFKQIWNHV